MIGCRALTPSEVQAMYSAFTFERDRTWFLLGCNTGFRISELLQLQVRHVEQGGQILYDVYLERTHMKMRKEGRSIPLSGEARSILADWLDVLREKDACSPGAFLFRSQKGENRPISRRYASQLLTDVAQATGATGKVNTHSMRKTFADWIYKQTHDLLLVREALGQKSIETTIRYLPSSREEIAGILKDLSFLS